MKADERIALKGAIGRVSRGRFIRLGAALGLGIAGASALAACAEEPPEHAAKAPRDGAHAGGQEIAQISKVPAGSAVNFEESGSPAVLVHLQNGKFAAYSAVCTHQGCTVAYRNGELLCPCHGSVFDPSRGGAVLSGPAPSPLPRIPLKVQSGGIYRA
jgi:Rieske Fe-S protein